ncbi:hypothetical protein ACVWZ6_002703 [Bradyrhizobium sp. GM6.1]
MASPSAWTAGAPWRNNVFVERLWRGVNYEEVYLRAYDTAFDARAYIGRYLAFHPFTTLLFRQPGPALTCPVQD